MQVTQFACGGFVVGFRFSHAVADGLGAAKFMGAVGELARGADQISPSSTWGRNAIPDPAGAHVGSLPKVPEAVAADLSVTPALGGVADARVITVRACAAPPLPADV